MPLLWVVGLGPRRATVRLSDTALLVHMGWAFHAIIPRHAIVRGRLRKPIWYAVGVHSTSRGRWIVNGSARGIVALDLAPPVPARTLGFPIRLREVDLSLVEPEAFLTALGNPSQAS